MTPNDADSTSPRTAPAFAELSGKAQERIDQACDEFEAAWQAVVTRPDQSAMPPDGWPALADCIANLTGGERTAALRELVPIDVSYRRRCGAPVTIADYAGFADLDAEWLSQVVLNPDGETRRIHLASEPPLPPPPTLPPPRLVLGDYVILSSLGQGGMGTVYRARHQRMDRIVAIKVLPRSTAHEPHVANRFRREIRAVARLSHPHIVAAFDAGEDDGVMYLVMECIDGLDLSTWVRRHGPLSVADAVECIAQAADGMDYAHQQGIIHRDIKPSNLLMQRGDDSSRSRETSDQTEGSSRSRETSDRTEGSSRSRETSDRTLTSSATSSSATSSSATSNSATPAAVQSLHIKVLDLGLARIDTELPASEETAVTRSGMIFGTAEYMSPEQAMNVRLADQRSDIYSLGCTLFFLLTGRPVVSGETYMEMVMAHQLLTLPSLAIARPDVPAELEQIFRRMTARKPEDRFASMREVREALRAIPSDRLPTTLPERNDSTGIESSLPGGTPQWIPNEQATEDEISRRGAAIAEDVTAIHSTPKPLRALSLRVRSCTAFVRTRPIRAMLAAVVMVLLMLVAWHFTPVFHSPRRNEEQAAQPLSFPAGGQQVQATQQAWAKHLGVPTAQPNSIGLTMVLIPPGEFTMGTTEAEYNHLSALIPNADELSTVSNERPPRHVRLQKPFWIGQTEITFGQFRQFADDSGYVTDAEKSAGYGVVNGQWVLQPGFSWRNTGEQPLTDDHPASNLSWNDAVALCRWLTSYESKGGQSVTYRLPTEAEWEYACRAGTDTPWFFGSDPTRLPEFAVTFANSNNRQHPVKTRQPNPFGLFDLYGNESEWCHDLFAPYEPTVTELLNPTDPANRAPGSAPERMQRGGSFNFPFHRQRSAAREGRTPDSPMHGGVRVLREP